MATWKKVIVSGSNAELNQITASGGIDAILPSIISTPHLVAYNSTTGQFSYVVTSSITAATASYVNSSNVDGPFGANSISSASYALTASFASNVPSTASYALQALSASYASSVNDLTNAITNNADNRVITATGGGTINGESNLTFDGTTLTVNGNATITGNLNVAGTASFTNTDNLNVKDKFILINSGSSTLADSGWVTQYNAGGLGSAFYLDADSTGTYGRFAVAYDISGVASSVTPDEFVVTAKINQASNPSADPTWGGSSNGSANMWITNAGEIYIYA